MQEQFRDQFRMVNRSKDQRYKPIICRIKRLRTLFRSKTSEIGINRTQGKYLDPDTKPTSLDLTNLIQQNADTRGLTLFLDRNYIIPDQGEECLSGCMNRNCSLYSPDAFPGHGPNRYLNKYIDMHDCELFKECCFLKIIVHVVCPKCSYREDTVQIQRFQNLRNVYAGW